MNQKITFWHLVDSISKKKENKGRGGAGEEI